MALHLQVLQLEFEVGFIWNDEKWLFLGHRSELCSFVFKKIWMYHLLWFWAVFLERLNTAKPFRCSESWDFLRWRVHTSYRIYSTFSADSCNDPHPVFRTSDRFRLGTPICGASCLRVTLCWQVYIIITSDIIHAGARLLNSPKQDFLFPPQSRPLFKQIW